MGFWSWITREDKENNDFVNLKDEKEWIQVFLTINYGKTPKEKVTDVAMEILQIFAYAQSIFDEEGRYLGYINPKTNQNIAIAEGSKKHLTSTFISKPFAPEIKKIDGNWKLIFTHKGKYSLPALYKDLFILWNICESVMQLYVKNSGVPATFNTIFIDNKPAIERLEKLLKFHFKVEDMINFGEKKNVNITEKCLGGTAKSFLNVIKKKKFYSAGTKLDKDKSEEVEKWIEEVEKLIR